LTIQTFFYEYTKDRDRDLISKFIRRTVVYKLAPIAAVMPWSKAEGYLVCPAC